MDAAMDRIVINVKLNHKQAVRGLAHLKKTLEELQKISNSAIEIRKSGIAKIETLAVALDHLSDAGGSKLSAALRNIRKLSKMDFSNLSKAASGVNDIADALDKINNFSSIDIDENGSGSKNLPVIQNINTELSKTKNLIDDINDEGVFGGSESVGGNGSNEASKMPKKLQEFIGSIKRIALYRLIRSIVSAVTNAIKDGIDAVYQYSKTINGTFSKSMDSLATSANYLKSSLGTVVAQLITIITPAIELVVDRVVEALNLINQVIAWSMGEKTWTKAIKVETEYAEATEAATEANEKLKQSFLGIDEINTLNTATDSASENSIYKFEEVALNADAVGDIVAKFKQVYTLVKLIGEVIAAWKMATALTEGINNLLMLQTLINSGLLTSGINTEGAEQAAVSALPKTLKWAVGLTLVATSVTLLFDGIKKLTDGDPDNDLIGAVESAIGVALGVAGVKNILSALGFAVSIPTLILSFASMGLIVAGIAEVINGETMKDKMLGALLASLGVAAFATIAFGTTGLLLTIPLVITFAAVYGVMDSNEKLNKFKNSVQLVNSEDKLPELTTEEYQQWISDQLKEDMASKGLDVTVSSTVGGIQTKTSSSETVNTTENTYFDDYKEELEEMKNSILSIGNKIVDSVDNKDTTVTLDGQKVSKSVTKTQNKATRMYGVAQYAQ